MKTDCKETSEIERSLQVTVEGEVILREIDKAYGKLNHRVRIKGFRPGKVPRQVLERYYKGEVENEVLGRLVGEHYALAVKEHAMQPVSQPEIKNGEYIPGQDFHFSARVEIRPTIELKKYLGLQVTKAARSVGDADIDGEIERLRSQHSRVEPVEDRQVVQTGDLVVTNFKATVDGTEFQGGNGIGYIMNTAEPNFLPEVIAAIVDRPLGDAFQVEVDLPADFRNQDVAGKQACFEVTPLQIKRKVMPEVDDEFAKDVGDYASLGELRTKLRGELEQKFKTEDDDAFREAVVNALIEGNPFPVPPSLIERQLDLMLYQSIGGLPPEQLKALGIDLGRLREEMRQRAEWKVRRGMLLERIAETEEIDVNKQDLEDRLSEIAARTGQPMAKIKSMYNETTADDLRFSILLEQALKLVIDKLEGADTATVEAGALAEEGAGS